MHDSVRVGLRRLLTGGERLRIRFAPDHPLLRREAATASVRPGSRVLFVCLGNVNRSPFAERYARRRFDDAVDVESAGFVRRQGRESPGTAVEVADEFGVDLGDHRSRTVTASSLADADVVFLMDVRNYRMLRTRFRLDHGETFLLGALSGSSGSALSGRVGSAEIPDPHGDDREEYRRVFGRIADAVDALAADPDRDDGRGR